MDPVDAVTVPGGHCLHMTAPELRSEKLPAPQSKHVPAPGSGWCVPAGHGWRTVLHWEPSLTSEYVLPSTHGAHSRSVVEVPSLVIPSPTSHLLHVAAVTWPAGAIAAALAACCDGALGGAAHAIE